MSGKGRSMAENLSEPAELWTAHGLRMTAAGQDGQALVCTVSGEIDFDNHRTVATALEALLVRRPPLLVMDLSELVFCDSSGLNVLLQARQTASESGCPMRLVAPGEQVGRLLALTGTDKVFEVRASVSQAIGD